MDFLKNSKQERIAFFWACINRHRGNISVDFSDFRGFTFKVKGFTVGDNRGWNASLGLRGSRGLYWWWTGEIYALDPNVVPTADRDDFQSGPAKNILLSSVQKLLSDLETKRPNSSGKTVLSRCWIVSTQR